MGLAQARKWGPRAQPVFSSPQLLVTPPPEMHPPRVPMVPLLLAPGLSSSPLPVSVSSGQTQVPALLLVILLDLCRLLSCQLVPADRGLQPDQGTDFCCTIPSRASQSSPKLWSLRAS